MQNNPINISGLDHVVLRTIKMQSMIAFYTEVLGCSVEREVRDIGLVQLRAGAALIDLLDVDGRLGGPGRAPAPNALRNMDHLCVQLRSWDEAAIRAHLNRFGIEAGAVAQRYGALGSGPSLYIKDPDGNTVELKANPH